MMKDVYDSPLFEGIREAQKEYEDAEAELRVSVFRYNEPRAPDKLQAVEAAVALHSAPTASNDNTS